MEEILKIYYADNAKKLRKIIDEILSKFGGLSDKDMDDFYSIANEVFVDVIKHYDGTQPFEGFLYACLLNKFKTEMTKRNREKRRADRNAISIDMPVDETEDLTLGDMIADDFDVEREILERREEGYSERVLMYLKKLSTLQRQVLKLTIDGYLPSEIQKELYINERQYADCNAAIHSYRNISVLF